MCNRLYAYLTENNLICVKQLGIKAAHWTEHAIVQLVNQILDSFNEDKFTLGIFIDVFIDLKGL